MLFNNELNNRSSSKKYLKLHKLETISCIFLNQWFQTFLIIYRVSTCQISVKSEERYSYELRTASILAE